MRYALSGTLTALSFSLTNALKVDRFQGCAAVITHTHYVYATAEPSAFSGAEGSASYRPGSGDARLSLGVAALKESHDYATVDASTTTKPSHPPDLPGSATKSSSKTTSSTDGIAATEYWTSSGVDISSTASSPHTGLCTPSGSYANAISTPGAPQGTSPIYRISIETGSSSAEDGPSTGAPAATGHWSSYGVPFTNSSTAGALRPNGTASAVDASSSVDLSISTEVSSAGVFFFPSSIIAAPTDLPTAPNTVPSADASAAAFTNMPTNSTTNLSVISSTNDLTVSFTTSTAISSTAISSTAISSTAISSTAISSTAISSTVSPVASATGTYGPNVIPDGHFDGQAAPSDWLGSRKNVGEQAQSGSYVLSAKANKKSYNAAHFSYVIGPLNWKGKYHLRFYHKLETILPEGVQCSLSVGMGIDGLTKVKLTPSDTSKGWQKVEVNDIPINSAINELSFDYYCDDDQFFEDGGEVEFWLDTVDMYEEILPIATVSQVCSTSAPTGTPGPNLISGGAIYQPSVRSTMLGWDWQGVTAVKDVSDFAHSSPYVLVSRINELLPFASVSTTFAPRSIAVKYTISLWVRFIYTNMPENSRPTLTTTVGVHQVDKHEFEASDLQKEWTNIVIKDVKMEKFSDALEFNFFDYNYQAQLVPGGELEYWLDDVEMYEQAPEIIICS